MSDLILTTKETAAKVFAGDGLDDLLADIRTAATADKPDITTAKGRKEIASRAHAVAKSKVIIDDAGKAITAGWKKKAEAVDRARRKSRETLDALKAEVRKPLTDWEEERDRLIAEQKRVAAEEEAERQRIERERIETEERDRARREAELAERERNLREAEEKARAEAQRKEDERKAADALAKRKEREAKEAEEQARRDEEERQQREHDAAVRAEGERLKATRKAESDKKAAVKAAVEKEKRAQRERDEAARQAELAEQARLRKLERDKANRTRVHDTIKTAFIDRGLSDDDAQSAMELIAGGFVPHVHVDYAAEQF